MQKSIFKLISVLVVGVLVGLGLGYGLAISFTPKVQGEMEEQIVYYKIGVTIPLTGELSSIGKLWEHVVDMAFEDVNKEMEKYGFNIRFKAVVLDDATSDEKALQNIQTFAQQGIKVVIGPAASSQVKTVKSYADANKIVIISPSSTAPTLAIPNDYIFRTTGSDTIQAKALAALVAHEGLTNVVIFHRDDEYGMAFADFLTRELEALGIQVSSLKYASGLSDYASEVAALSSKVSEVGADGVILISFDTDGANILSHAKEDPVLSRIRWLSGEGIHGAGELLTQDLAEWLIQVKFMGTRPIFVANPLYKEFSREFKDRFGADPPVFSEKLYDSVFLAAWAIIRAGSYDGEAIAAALPEVAAHYYGLSGWCILNDAGDRAVQDYSIWTIMYVDGEYSFVDIGTYSAGTITFLD